MKNHLLASVSILFSLAAASCSTENPEPVIVGPEPLPVIKHLGRDSISEGNYRGIAINSSADDAFLKLETYRENKQVAYLGAVNNYFSDVSDLENRIHLFDWLVLDEKFDTDSGVQVQLESGKIKSITLNNRREIRQWPENPDAKQAIQLGDDSQVIYKKLLLLSKQAEFANKFERIVLTTKYSYAIYDVDKANLPWSFMYFGQTDLVKEQTKIYFKDKKVHYIIVDRFEQL